MSQMTAQTPTPVLGYMTIEGVEYPMRLSMWGIMKLEELTGEDMGEVNGRTNLSRYIQNASHNMTCAMQVLWMLMLGDNPNLSFEWVAQHATIDNIVEFGQVAMNIATASLPQPEPPVDPNSALGKGSPQSSQQSNVTRLTGERKVYREVNPNPTPTMNHLPKQKSNDG